MARRNKQSSLPPTEEPVEKPMASSEPKPASANPLTKRRSRKFTIITIVSLVILATTIGGYFVFWKAEISSSPTVTTPTGQSAFRRLDGVKVAPEASNLPPVAIMVENLVAARPQAGLDQASVVYEALAEGGITRFLAVFATDSGIKEIGPVRSARPYYEDWAKELDAPYMHVGGSPTALQRIPTIKLKDVDQFFNSAYFWRSKQRSAPHNLYTSSELMVFMIRDLFPDLVPTYTPWKFADGMASRQTAQTISVDFSSFSYLVEWRYDPATNAYSRLQAGEPHLMADQKPITAANVIVQYVATSLEDAQRLSMETVGSGRAQVFHNGETIEATWTKDSIDGRTIYKDASGQEVTFTRGATWVEILPTDRTVTVT